MVEVECFFLLRKRKLKVDLGELEHERESLSSFLCTKLKVEAISEGNNVLVDSEGLPSQELKRVVNKFVYHRHLNNEYWVALEGGVVKINKFKGAKKHEKGKKEATPPSTIKHGW
jgi:hypothetical protein